MRQFRGSDRPMATNHFCFLLKKKKYPRSNKYRLLISTIYTETTRCFSQEGQWYLLMKLPPIRALGVIYFADVKKVLKSMNHSLIPLLKFHPEQACPHTDKGGHWEAKWDEGSGEQTQTLPVKGQQKKQQRSSHYSFSSLSHPDWRTRQDKFIVYDRKICMLRTIGCGYQTAGGWR